MLVIADKNCHVKLDSMLALANKLAIASNRMLAKGG